MGIRKVLVFIFVWSILARASVLSVFPKTTFPGGVFKVKLPLSSNAEELPKLTVNGTEVSWDLCPRTKEKTLCAFIGVPLDNAPAAFVVKSGELTEKVMVVEKKYPKSKLKVEPKHAIFSPEDQKRIDEEKKVLAKVFTEGSKKYLWTESFKMPCKGNTTGWYGTQRVFNDTIASVHYGTDLRANQKTLIKSSNAGRVAFVGNLFNGGNFVAIDHGGGIFTTYSHLSSYVVKTGDLVKRDQKIGMAGATGRVTGPHLHWSVRINDLYVDPLIFVKVAE